MMNKTKVSFGKLLSFEIKFCFRTCPFLMCGEIIASVVHGLSFVLVMYVTQLFFDKVADAVVNKKSFEDVMLWALMLGGTVILNQIINGFENWLYGVLYNKLKGYSILNLYNKTYKINAEKFEDSNFLDVIKKAREGAEHFIFPLFPIIAVLSFYSAYFLGIGWYVFNVYPVLAYAILVIFIPSFLGQYVKTKLFSKLADDTANYKRRFEYFEQCICGKEYYKETSLLSATRYFEKLYKQSLKDLTDMEWKTNKKSAVIFILARMLTLVGYLIVLFMFVDALMKGNISVGVFATIFASIERMFGMMDDVVNSISNLVQNIGLVENYVDFLEQPEENKQNRVVTLKNTLELKNVTFRYKGAPKDTLVDLNLKIKAGETIAIVGENGSGKTTLVKVMMGLFSSTKGQVLYDGIDISKVKRENVYNIISVVGQNFIKYMMNLRNNVSISKNFSGDEKPDCTNDNIINELLRYVDISMEQKELKENGLDTMLGREFDGIDLSGGQWQRIAIARGMFRPHQMIILDEPTAAIDPVEESKIFQMFSEMSKDSTSIIVTHRMGCAKIADKIIVMDQGRIVEEGIHDELISKPGKYKEMYEAQLQWYQ